MGNKGKLNFDAATHTYTVEGIGVIPSVTQVLKETGLVDYRYINQAVLSAASAFGVAVHRATELYDRDRLDEEKLDANLVPHLSSWKKFVFDFKFCPLHIEERGYSAKYLYGYTYDRVGVCESSKFAGKLVLVDIKTGIPLPGFHAQTAAYAKAHEEQYRGDKIKARIAVYLKAEGYSVEEHKDESDFTTFLSALHLYNFKKLNNIK